MIILTIRTDNPRAEIGLYDDAGQLIYERWQAHRQLAETIHRKISELLEKQGISLQDIKAIAVYEGPGSFTGLRIGVTVANALANALSVPVTATTGDDWKEKAISLLRDGKGQNSVMPEYGSTVHVTQPRR
jgi:tRNA threonylcarbamoyladenosine biosynthesis protein TsaB